MATMSCEKLWTLDVIGCGNGPYIIDPITMAAFNGTYGIAMSGILNVVAECTWIDFQDLMNNITLDLTLGVMTLQFIGNGTPSVFTIDSGHVVDPTGPYSFVGGAGFTGYPPGQPVVSL